MINTTLSKALESLGVTRYTFAGSPKTEEEFYASFQLVQSIDEDTGATVYVDPANYSFTWAELQAQYDAVAVEIAWEKLRAERDRLLAETDWVVSRAVDASNDGLGIQLPQVWMDYRQALRDLPANTTDPSNPVWPTKP